MDCTTIFSPNTGRTYGRWRPDSPKTVAEHLAVLDQSRRELEGDVQRRVAVLDALIDAMETVRSELAQLTVDEVGKKPAEAADEIDYAISFLSYCRKLAREYRFTTAVDGRTIREVAPGVALLITPFNDPLAGITRKIGPAIAAGASVLVKPAPLGMLCAQAMNAAFQSTSAASFVRFACLEDPSVTETLIMDPRVGVVSFTGSTRVGSIVAVAAAQNHKRAVLELGSNAPFVILADADLDRALDDLMARKLRAAGQACSSVNRVYVDRRVYLTFREMLIERVKRLTLGPSTTAVDLGPLRTAAAMQQLECWSVEAVSMGERLVAGSAKGAAEGEPFLFPMSVIEADSASLFDRIETFGPILSLRAFDQVDALLAVLEAERHALVAYFYTGCPEVLEPKLKNLRFGSIGLNTTAIQGADMPTGGFGEAGVGREGGPWGLREFLATINQRGG